MGSPIEQTPPGAGKTPTTPSRVADLATAVDGGSGTQRIYSPSSQGRLVLSIHAGVGASHSEREELKNGKKTETSPPPRRDWAEVASDIESEESEEIPPAQPEVNPNNLMDRLIGCLSQKNYLQEKLIRAEHHLESFDNHLRRGIVPKGFQLERKFNPISMDGFVTKTRPDIEDILSKAERKIHNVMLDHHKKFIRVINRKLEAVEEKIGKILHHPAASTTIQAALELMERQENSLKLTLQRSKQRKSSGVSTTSGGSLNTKVEASAGPSGERPNSTTTGLPDRSYKTEGRGRGRRGEGLCLTGDGNLHPGTSLSSLRGSLGPHHYLGALELTTTRPKLLARHP